MLFSGKVSAEILLQKSRLKLKPFSIRLELYLPFLLLSFLPKHYQSCLELLGFDSNLCLHLHHYLVKQASQVRDAKVN